MKKLFLLVTGLVGLFACSESNDEYTVGLRVTTNKTTYDSTETVYFSITNVKNESYYLPKCISGHFIVSAYKKIDTVNYNFYYSESCQLNPAASIDIAKNQTVIDSIFFHPTSGVYILQLEFGVDSHEIDAVIFSNEFTIQ